MKGLTGTYAVVTGGAKGIGKAIAARYLEEGVAGVALLDYDEVQSKAAAIELDPTGKRCIGVKCDVSERVQVREAVNEVMAAFGSIDILVNNAGITRDAMFHKMTDDQWDAVLNVNLNGVYNMCHTIYPLMREQEHGSILNITSTSAWGNPGQTNYSATKAALLGMTKTLAMEAGKKGVRVNAIAPGCIKTDMFNAVPEDLIRKFESTILLGRLGTVEEIAAAAAFLSSDDASFITGQCLSVSGGLLCL